MCYLLAIGAVADPLRLSAFFEETLDVDVAAAQLAVVVAFPAEDIVRSLTRGGCSCELLKRAAPAHSTNDAGTIGLTLACRRAVGIAAAELATVRIYVRSRKEWRAGRSPRFTMTIDELLEGRANIPTDVLIDVVVGIAPKDLN